MTLENFSTCKVGTMFAAAPLGRLLMAAGALCAGVAIFNHDPRIVGDFAKQAGLPDVFAQGMLSFGGLAQVVTKWAGIGRLRFGARFVSMTQVHDLIACNAVVADRFEADGEVSAAPQSGSPGARRSSDACR